MRLLFLFLFSILSINATIAKERDVENYIKEIKNVDIDKEKVDEASKIIKTIISVYNTLKIFMEKINNFISKIINIIIGKNGRDKQSIVFIYRQI